ncbi:MAG: Rid family detoxifying hydrolase [Bacteriovoracaceae bacterium]|nr:Rid family detoxifying hydrolase [Bacteriovoracaceae bacterium]
MKREILSTPKAPSAVGTYSQGVKHQGVWYFSGQIGLDLQGNMREGFDAQLEQVLKNIDGLLEGANLKRDHIIKTTIFMTDLGLFSKVNEAYTKFFQAPYPSRSTVQVPALPKGALVEIEVIAAAE